QVINEGHAALGSAIGQIVSSNTNVQTYALPVEIQGMNISQTETINGLVHVISNSGNAVIELSVEAGFYSLSEEITRAIGKVSEDWESQGFSGFAWENSSSVPWLIDQTNASNTTFSARSGDIGASQSTSLTLTMEAASADSIQFDLFVSCEEQGWSYYDYLEFFIDNVSKEKWAGEVSWTTVKYPVTAGSHTYKWTYKKDSYDDQGEDLARIDNILLPVTPEILANQAPIINSQPDTIVMVDEFYAYIFEASDPDGNSLTLNQSGLPGFISYTDNGNHTATISGTPASTDQGIYPVVLTAWDGVAFGSQVYFLHVIPTIGIPENETLIMHVSPNPASESILIQTNQNLKSGSISIYNKLGMLVKTIAPVESAPLNLTIDISNLPAGMYMIEYLDNDMNFSQKFIKINN
ncbi:MAG: T9SS type A sorting domain-containing protein, partial [Bacteroidales bacterium]|nr:T9SS type A sorting domain-containing protein [Bacteroidales bacterium]